MYSFLAVTARVKGPTEYDWLKFTGDSPVQLDFRGKPVTISKGDVFGVRPASSSKGAIRLVLKDEITKVMTIDLPTAKKLAKNCKRASAG